MVIKPALPVAPDSIWARRLADPDWLLLPLRAFLGITFSYAGLQKLANPDYLDPNSPTSVAAQMRLLQHSSPIGPLLGLSTHAPALVGLLIAFGELAVGVGTLLGLYTRLAALGGAALSLTFFLTVSWNTTPYYYGSDIVFLFAWIAMFGFGPGALSVEALVRGAAARSVRPGRTARAAALAQREVDRRTVVRTGVVAACVGAGTAILGGFTAAIGRAVGGTTPSPQVPAAARRSTAPVAGPSTRRSARRPAPPGTPIARAADVPVGQAKSFTDPATRAPAWLVHSSAARFVAFSAVCTHAGCPVQFDPAQVEFVCPCHGGIYDARSGKVLAGPPPAPLQPISVHVVAGEVRVEL